MARLLYALSVSYVPKKIKDSMHTQSEALFSFGILRHPQIDLPCRAEISLDAALIRKTILLTLHRYLEGNITHAGCLNELDRHRGAMTSEEQRILDADDL